MKAEPPKVYLSGGFTSAWQNSLTKELTGKFTFYNPRENLLEEPKGYTIWDLHHIKKSDILFGYLESSNPSGIGLSLEIGFASSLNITTILIDEKSKFDQNFKRYFSIVQKTADIVFEDFEEGVDFLKKFSF